MSSTPLFTLLLLTLLTISPSDGAPPLQPHPPDFGSTGLNHQQHQQPLSINRLPPSIIPTHYKLEIQPVLDAGFDGLERFTAPGKIWITGTAQFTLTSITLNYRNIDINPNATSVSPPINHHHREIPISLVTTNPPQTN
jgi:hypothetical protein